MKKLLSIIIIVALVFLVAINIFLFVQNNNLKKEIFVLNKKIEELQQPKPVTGKIPDGWKEYVDEEYKFKILYPKEFSFAGNTDQTKIQKNKNKENTLTFYVNVLTDAPLGLLYINIYDSNSIIREFIKTDAENIIKYFPNIVDKNVNNYISVKKVNNMDFYKFEIPHEFIIKYYIKNDNKIFVLKPENEDLGLYPGLEKVVSQMVNSFTFTN